MSSHFDDEDEPVPEPPPAEPIDDEPTPPVDAFLDAHRLQDRRPSVVRPVRPAPIAATQQQQQQHNHHLPNNDDDDDDDAPPPPPPSATRVRSMTIAAHELPPPPLPPLLRVSSSSPPPVPQSVVSPRHAGGGRARAGTLSDARSPRAHESASASAPAQAATVKIFFRSLESGVSKVLPIDAGTSAGALVAELLRKLALAKIKVPEGRYELQAVAAGFVHLFADHETPQALLARQQGTQLICCRAEAAAAPRIAPVAGVLRDETGRIVPAGADAARPLSPPNAPQIGHFQGSYRPPPPPPTNVKPFSQIVQKVEMLDDDDDDDDDEGDDNNADDAAAPHSNLGVLNRHLEMQVSGRRRGSKGLLSASAERLASLLSPQPEEPPEDGAGDEDDDDMFRRALNAHAAQLVANGDGGGGDDDDDVPPPPSRQYDDDEELPPPPPLALPSELTAAPAPVRRNANMERRVQLVRELVDTERTYVRSLTLLKEQYMLPLEKAELLSKDEIKIVFSNIALLHSVHKELLSDLGARFYAATNESPCIGDIFAHLAPYLKLYAQYYRDFDRADQELKRVMQRSRVQAFCDKTKSDPRSRGLDLISFMIMPVQRLPRYVLLLEQLVEATPREHADFAPLASALKQMRDIVSSADAAVPPPPLTEAGKALAALGPTFAELNSSSLQLCDYAQRWRDAQLKSGGAVRLWLLREWLVVAPARGANVPHTVSKGAVSTKRYPAQQADVATVLGDTPSGLVDALRIPLSHVWVKRITWSDGLFELLTPLASHSFLLEMPTRARERWINKIHQLTQADALTPQQRAERARIEAPSKVFVNQIHWDSAFELPPARFAAPPPQPQQPKAAPAAAAAPQQPATAAKMTPAEVQEYKAAMKRKYAEEQRRSLALAAQRAAEAPPPPPAGGAAARGAAADKPSRPKVCQRCNAGKVFARCRVVGDGAIIFVCEPCASELAANHKTRKSAPPTRSASASDAPPEPAEDE
jgi:hypothetical protein